MAGLDRARCAASASPARFFTRDGNFAGARDVGRCVGTPDDRRALEGRCKSNPFDVLSAPLCASRKRIVAQARTLAEGLARHDASCATYDTPLGKTRRDVRRITVAAQTLRDTNLRLVHELWAALRPPRILIEAGHPAAALAFGWRSP